jgi:glycerol-3-phosphate acyltransferase PlsX
MGGDHAPAEIVAGARRAAEDLGIPVVLVGPTDGSLGDTGDVEVLAASEVIAMNDDPAQSVRTKGTRRSCAPRRQCATAGRPRW